MAQKWPKKSNLKKSLSGGYGSHRNDIHHWKAEVIRVLKMYNIGDVGEICLNHSLTTLWHQKHQKHQKPQKHQNPQKPQNTLNFLNVSRN